MNGDCFNLLFEGVEEDEFDFGFDGENGDDFDDFDQFEEPDIVFGDFH